MSDTKHKSFNEDLLAFILSSPTPFHAVATMTQQLKSAGFSRLNEADAWNLKAGEKYYLTRNDSSIIAFVYGEEPLLASGIRMVGAHTDSPCLKIKPKADIISAGYQQLGVEVYGSALLNTWFDRDLSIAGRITYKKNDLLASCMVDFLEPIVVIPSLAIHLDRDANTKRCINKQTDISPVVAVAEEGFNWTDVLKKQIEKQHPLLGDIDILDSDLSLYDTQKPALVGLKAEFIAAARLDNLLSCYVELQALCQADTAKSCLLVCNDHEEVGSSSACGADGPMLEHFLQRLVPNTEERLRVIDRSLMVSVDNAHGIHPNFKQKHDGEHSPLLNRGPVIKMNANQRYATNSETSGLFRFLCEKESVPVQNFVSRNDMQCGSTIGPITAAGIGVKTLDVGVPTFAMHSIRELAGSQDAWLLFKVLKRFFQSAL